MLTLAMLPCGHTSPKNKWGRCLVCLRANDKKSRERNREKRNAYRRGWYLRNKERCRIVAAAYRLANPISARKWSKTRRAIRRGAPQDGSVNTYWGAIIRAYRGLCAYCEKPSGQMDHVVPLSRGGAHVASNVRPACEKCNKTKGIKTWTPRPWAAALPSEAM